MRAGESRRQLARGIAPAVMNNGPVSTQRGSANYRRGNKCNREASHLMLLMIVDPPGPAYLNLQCAAASGRQYQKIWLKPEFSARPPLARRHHPRKRMIQYSSAPEIEP